MSGVRPLQLWRHQLPFAWSGIDIVKQQIECRTFPLNTWQRSSSGHLVVATPGRHRTALCFLKKDFWKSVPYPPRNWVVDVRFCTFSILFYAPRCLMSHVSCQPNAAPQEGISLIIDAETPTLEQVQKVILAQSKVNFWRPVPKDTSCCCMLFLTSCQQRN